MDIEDDTSMDDVSMKPTPEIDAFLLNATSSKKKVTSHKNSFTKGGRVVVAVSTLIAEDKPVKKREQKQKQELEDGKLAKNLKSVIANLVHVVNSN